VVDDWAAYVADVRDTTEQPLGEGRDREPSNGDQQQTWSNWSARRLTQNGSSSTVCAVPTVSMAWIKAQRN
jgi:hypothetical protein